MIDFSHPLLLFLLVPVLATAGYLIVAKRRYPILRLITLVLAVVALAGPFIVHETLLHNVFFLVDRSASVSATMHDEDIQAEVQRVMDATPNTEFGVIEFAQTPVVTVPLGSKAASLGTTALDDSGSRLQSAIDLALSIMPQAKSNQLVLVSDGRFSDSVEESLSLAQLANVPISILPIGEEVPLDVAMTNLSAPSAVQVGRPFDLTVTLTAQTAGPVRLVVYRDDDIVTVQDLGLEAGMTQIPIAVTMERLGTAVYQAIVKRAEDPISANDDLSVLVSSTEAPRVLLVDRLGTSQISTLLDALGIAYNVSESVPPLEILSNYRQLIVANGRLENITATEVETMGQFSRHLGGGVLFINGEEATRGFSRGGIEDILPVTFSIPEKTEEASLAIVYLLDRSASMRSRVDGVEKIEVLKEAAIASINLLDEEALVGIVAFDRVFDWVLPIEPIDFERIAGALQPMNAIGGTDIYFPLVDALDRLDQVEARSKHILLISDGKAGDDVRDYPGLVQRLLSTPDTTLSAIAVGSAPNTTLLGALVTAGGGSLYLADDFSTLPQVSIRATQRLSRDRFVTDETLLSGRLADALSPETIPPLQGYVVSYPKETAQTLLWGGEDPVVATWRVGLGSVTVLNTDLDAMWSQSWFDWESLPRLFEGILATTEPDVSSTWGMTASVSVDGAMTSLLVDARNADGSYANFLDIEADILPLEASFPLDQVAPGLYHLSIPTPSKGGYAIQINDRTRQQALPVPFSVPYSTEYEAFGANRSVLAWIAATTGGTMLDESLGLPDTSESVVDERIPLQEALILAVLGLFLLDLVVRKWPIRRRPNAQEQ